MLFKITQISSLNKRFLIVTNTDKVSKNSCFYTRACVMLKIAKGTVDKFMHILGRIKWSDIQYKSCMTFFKFLLSVGTRKDIFNIMMRTNVSHKL